MTAPLTMDAPFLQLAQANQVQPTVVAPAAAPAVPVAPQASEPAQQPAQTPSGTPEASGNSASTNAGSEAGAVNPADASTVLAPQTGAENTALPSGDPAALPDGQAGMPLETSEQLTPPPEAGHFLTDGIEKIGQIMDMGGPVVMLLAVLSVLSLTVIFYKLWQFSWLGIGRHKRARKALGLWRQGQQVDAISLLGKGKAPVSVVLLHAMRGQLFHADKGALIREDVERVALRSLSKTRFLLRFLETVGQISPLLGLFGTVIGMIEAFQRLQQAGATVDPSVLAGGIWVALLTTAVGLAVAIPASLFADWFSSRVEREQEVIEELVTSVLTGQLTDATAPAAAAAVNGEPAYAS